MREQYGLATLAGYFRDGGGDPLEPGRVGNPTLFHGHVEINAQQHALALYVDVIEGAECLAHYPGLADSSDAPRRVRGVHYEISPHGEERALWRASRHLKLPQSE